MKYVFINSNKSYLFVNYVSYTHQFVIYFNSFRVAIGFYLNAIIHRKEVYMYF